jgi:nickel/cobalt transporter (NicO) family protein
MIDVLLPATLIGFTVGFRHAFEADHLAAVTTLATRESSWRTSARLGVVWGVGHTLSIAAVAALLIVLGVTIPEAFFATSELGVAALLIALGVWALFMEARRAPATPVVTRTSRGALGFGVVHGLAGSGAVIVLLVAASSQVAVQAGYLAAFGVGTVLGMSIASLLAGAATGLAATRSVQAARWIRIGAGVLSLLAGMLLGYEVLTSAR